MFRATVLTLSVSLFCCVAPAFSDAKPVALERAKGPALHKAVGHYARARSLLIAAVREFDQATALVNPQALLDQDAFRKALLDRAEDLETVLDPQPRASEIGVRFEPDSRLLGEATKK
ncbi:MAG: hypothetical protein KDD64_09270 [Bdellovibrionales bacterium]|nr:hypothetical protein [Bdellovibrionales bacterium]